MMIWIKSADKRKRKTTKKRKKYGLKPYGYLRKMIKNRIDKMVYINKKVIGFRF